MLSGPYLFHPSARFFVHQLLAFNMNTVPRLQTLGRQLCWLQSSVRRAPPDHTAHCIEHSGAAGCLPARKTREPCPPPALCCARNQQQAVAIDLRSRSVHDDCVPSPNLPASILQAEDICGPLLAQYGGDEFFTEETVQVAAFILLHHHCSRPRTTVNIGFQLTHRLSRSLYFVLTHPPPVAGRHPEEHGSHYAGHPSDGPLPHGEPPRDEGASLRSQA